MSQFTKYIGLLFASISAALCAAPAFAMISSTAEELYSEAIYIHKSSAEVPGALASNASPGSEVGLPSAAEAPLESMEETNSVVAPEPKKLSSRRRSKK